MRGLLHFVIIPLAVTTRLRSAWLPLFALLTLPLPTPVQAQFSYIKGNSSITITGYTGTNGDVVIPPLLEELPVTRIENEAFEYSPMVTVKIPDTVTFIGYAAFFGCDRLTSLTLPSSLTGTDTSAFGSCTSLTNLVVPEGVTGIGQDAFEGCNGLTTVSLPSSVSMIGNEAFGDCQALASITVGGENRNYSSRDGVLFSSGQGRLVQYPTAKAGSAYVIPEHVFEISDSAFRFCARLTSITIPSNVTAIGSGAFDSCTGLTNITLPDRLEYIGFSAFGSCTNLIGVLIPDSVTDLGAAAFFGCSNLREIAIGKNVTLINYGTFSYCTTLTRITIPLSVTNMTDPGFGTCSNLASITVEAENPSFSSNGGVLFTRDGTQLILYPPAKAGSSYHVPENVALIQEGAFTGRTMLTEVTIPPSVRLIGPRAFAACVGLTPLNLPGSVTNIGASAFAACHGLTSIALPASIVEVGDLAFAACRDLTNIMVDPANPTYASVGGVFFNKSLTRLIQYPAQKANDTYLVPDTVTDISDFAFTFARLGSLVISGGVTNLGTEVFHNCAALTNVTVAPDNAFYSSVDGVLFDKAQTQLIRYPAHKIAPAYQVPEGVTTIAPQAFGFCTSLTGVTLPRSLTSISSDAFAFCARLTSVYFDGNAPAYVLSGYEPEIDQGPGWFHDLPITVYYLPGTTGWTDRFGERPAAVRYPRIVTEDGKFGAQAGHFGFTLAGATGTSGVVEACDNLAASNWVPVSTISFNVDGLSQFIDPDLSNQTGRFYRFRTE